MTSRRRLWLFSSIGALLVFGCVALLNLLSHQFYGRIDLSDGKLYSLSDGSKRILGKMEDPVEIRVYFSEELPAEYSANRSYLRDILREFRDASGGKVRARFVNVDKESEGREEALRNGVVPVQFNVISQEKYEVREGLMGVVIQKEDQKDVIPVVVNTAGFEYDLTSRLLHLTRKERPVVGIASSHGAIGPESLHPRVRELLERNYELEPVDLTGPRDGIGGKIGALLVLGPSEKLDAAALYAVDQFVLSGRPAALSINVRKTDLRQFMASSIEPSLAKLTRHYGVGVRHNLVLDAQNQPVQVQQSRGFITFSNIIPYPAFVVARDLNTEHPVTRDLEGLTLPFVAPLEISTAAASVTVLARSSKYSWLRGAWGRGAVHSVNPLQSIGREPEDEAGPFPLAAIVEGDLNSYFSPGSDGENALPSGASESAHRKAGKGRLIVAGTARFADAQMPVGETGMVFLMNLIDWMALDADLISIRSKGVSMRPLAALKPAYKTFVRWCNIIGPALLLALFGVMRMRLRRRTALARSKRFSSSNESANA